MEELSHHPGKRDKRVRSSISSSELASELVTAVILLAGSVPCVLALTFLNSSRPPIGFWVFLPRGW